MNCIIVCIVKVDYNIYIEEHAEQSNVLECFTLPYLKIMYVLSKRDEFIRQTLFCMKTRYSVMSTFWRSLVVICQLFFFLQGNEAIKYLEFCIEQLDNKDQAIHNYLLSLYAKLKPDQLMTYLNIQGTVRLLHIIFFLL